MKTALERHASRLAWCAKFREVIQVVMAAGAPEPTAVGAADMKWETESLGLVGQVHFVGVQEENLKIGFTVFGPAQVAPSPFGTLKRPQTFRGTCSDPEDLPEMAESFIAALKEAMEPTP